MYRNLILFLNLAFLMTAITPAHASRIALVIGNANYKEAALLHNPTNDANDMKKILTHLGFEVILETNADRRTMIKAIQKFGTRLHHADVGLFFYAGHGLQVEGNNYLVPVNANIQSEADIEHESVEVARILKQMEYANNGVNIVILDACRNNPYKRGFRDLTRGLVRLNAPTGTLIAYATAPGDVADDGKGRNSPFTKNLLSVLHTMPYLSITDLFTKVTGLVVKETKKKQVPWQSVSLTQRFCFEKCEKPRTCPDCSRLLRECETHLEANRLTTGRGGTAFVCYRDVLTKDPNNVEAERGLKEIEDRYATWIKRALDRRQCYKAKRYFPRLSKVNPDSPHLAEFERRLKTSCPVLTRTFVSSSVETPEMVWIPADESIDSFAIGRYEVTFAEYDKFAKATGRSKPNDEGWEREKKPVINVSWGDAMAYAEWLSEQTGQKYSLPTDAEWEYSARAGTETGRDEICQYANVRDKTLEEEKGWGKIHNCTDGYSYTAPVGSFKANDFGLFNMLGNVSEWTCSENSKDKKCTGEVPAGAFMIVRGGAWKKKLASVSAVSSLRKRYELGYDYIGFRLVRH